MPCQRNRPSGPPPSSLLHPSRVHHKTCTCSAPPRPSPPHTTSPSPQSSRAEARHPPTSPVRPRCTISTRVHLQPARPFVLVHLHLVLFVLGFLRALVCLLVPGHADVPEPRPSF